MLKKRILCLFLVTVLVLPAAAVAPLSFEEVGGLVEADNRQVKINTLTLAALRSNGTVADAQNSIYRLSNGLSSVAASLMQSGDAIGIASGNGLSLTAEYIAAQARSIDISQNDIKLYELQFAQADEKLQNAAESLLPMLSRLDIGEAAAKRALPLLKDVLTAKKVAQSRGLATDGEVLLAELDIAKLKAQAAQLTSDRQSLIMQLNMLIGRSYDTEMELAPLPEPDTAYIDETVLETDIAEAKAASYDIAILRREYSNIKKINSEGDEIPSAIKQREAKRLEIEAACEQLAVRMTQLKRNIIATRENLVALEIAQRLAELEAEQAASKYALGRLTRLEADSMTEAALSAADAVQNAKIELFWMIETYKWAVKGLMPEA